MATSAREWLRKCVVVGAFLFCIYKFALIFGHHIYWDKFANDFGVYWRVANQPVGAVYFWKGEFPFPYAPTMLLWIQPLSWVPKWPAYFLFVWGSSLALVLSLRPYVHKGAIVLTLFSPPVLRGLFTGQVCIVLAAAMIWACETRNRILAGIAFGVIATIKPQLVLMAPLLFVLDRDWKAFLSAGLAFTAIVILSLILFGPARWPEWLASMDHFHNAVAGTEIIKMAVTPAAIAERFGFAPLPFMLVGTLAGAGLVYLCRSSNALEKAAAVTAGSLLAAPYALSYDLVSIMPLLALAVFRGNILAAWGAGTSIIVTPLILSTYELLRPKRSSHGKGNAKLASDPV